MKYKYTGEVEIILLGYGKVRPSQVITTDKVISNVSFVQYDETNEIVKNIKRLKK